MFHIYYTSCPSQSPRIKIPNYCILGACYYILEKTLSSRLLSKILNVNTYITGCIVWLCGLVAQAVRRSPPTAGVPSSRLGHSMWFRGGRNGVWVGFSRGFSRFPLSQLSFHHFSTLISSISFHFISPCVGASGVVGRHPCYSRTYNIGASSHLIPRPHELRIFYCMVVKLGL